MTYRHLLKFDANVSFAVVSVWRHVERDDVVEVGEQRQHSRLRVDQLADAVEAADDERRREVAFALCVGGGTACW